MNEEELRTDFANAWNARRSDILKIIRGICRSADETEEMYHRIFFEIFDGKRTWEPGTDVVYYVRWVLKSIRSNRRTSAESKSTQPEGENDDAPTSKPNPEQRAMGKQVWLEIHDGLPELPQLVFAQSLNGLILPKEIALALNVPIERVNKAKEKIKEVTEKVLRRHGLPVPWEDADEG